MKLTGMNRKFVFHTLPFLTLYTVVLIVAGKLLGPLAALAVVVIAVILVTVVVLKVLPGSYFDWD